MNQSLWIDGPLPGMNEIIEAAKGHGGKGIGYSKLKAAWTDKVCWLAKAARLKPVAAARFTFLWHEKNRQRNPDNIAAAHKFVFDGLVLAKILPNDGWGEVLGWADDFVVSAKPGVLVCLE